MATLPQASANDNQDLGVEPRLVHLSVANDGSDQDRLTLAMDDARRVLRRVVDIKLGYAGTFAQRETAYLQVGNDISCLNMQEELQALADSHADALMVDGVLYRRHQAGKGQYHSLCG